MIKGKNTILSQLGSGNQRKYVANNLEQCYYSIWFVNWKIIMNNIEYESFNFVII